MMKNYNNLVEVTKLLDENLSKLDKLNFEKQKLIELYNKNQNDINTLNKIKNLENEYKIVLNEAKNLNLIIKKISG